jgi:hypothetical protein
MHKKLEGELLSLAHSILQMKNKDDINALQQKALAVYEKLSMLKFVNAYLESETSEGIFSVEENVEPPIPVADFTEELIDNVKEKVSETNSDKEISEEDEKNTVEIEELSIETEETMVEKISVETETFIEEDVELTHDDVEKIFGTKKGMISEEENTLRANQFSLEEEFKDAISADVATQMFENATKKNPIVESKPDVKSRSLNDALLTSKLQVGLNDRIAFVKHLFDGSQEDFSRVLSQLNTFKTEKEAKDFIYNLVKPDYNWKTKEEYEARLMDLIERKFM